MPHVGIIQCLLVKPSQNLLIRKLEGTLSNDTRLLLHHFASFPWCFYIYRITYKHSNSDLRKGLVGFS